MSISVRRKGIESNTRRFGDALSSLKKRIEDKEIIIKSEDKGDLTIVMSPSYYYNMCMRELEKHDCYENIGPADPGERVLQVVYDFATKYQQILTRNEYNYLTKKFEKCFWKLSSYV